MIFDGHSDIFSDVRYKREAGETQVLKNHHLDRLRKGGIGGACFVIWADTYNGHAPKDEMEAIVKGIKGEMAETKEFVLIHNVEELKAAEAAGKFAILLGIEGLAGIGEDLSKIDELYDLGARHAMLTWNEENALATGVKGDPNRGVTELGKQAIKKLQEKKQEEIQNIRNGIGFAKKVLTTGECDLLILDEVLGLVEKDIITVDTLKTLLECRGDTDVILTGITLNDEICVLADEVSRIETVKFKVWD